MADCDRERVGGVVRSRLAIEAEDRRHHPLHLALVGAPIAADGLLHTCRRILGAADPGAGGGDEHGPARLTDGERDAGVGADVGLLEDDRIRGVCLDEPGDAVEERQEP